MNKALIYPYDYEFYPILENCIFFNDLEIVKLVSPSGWGLNGTYYNFGNTHLEIENNFEVSLLSCDILWIVNSRLQTDFNNDVLPKIELAAKYNKKIFYTRNITSQEKKILNTYYEDDVIFFSKSDKIVNLDILKDEIYSINVPVVFITGLTEYTDKTLTQLRLWRELVQKSYDSIILTTKKECELFSGAYTIPDFMFDRNFTEREKIIKFNHFVKNIERIKRPEIFIINIPGELMTVSRGFTGNFGILGYEISQSIRPDCVIMNLPYEDHSIKDIYKIGERASYRLGCGIDFFNIVDRILDITNTKLNNKYEFVGLSSDFVQKKLENVLNEKIFHVSFDNQIKKLADAIIDMLSKDTSIDLI